MVAIPSPSESWLYASSSASGQNAIEVTFVGMEFVVHPLPPKDAPMVADTTGGPPVVLLPPSGRAACPTPPHREMSYR